MRPQSIEISPVRPPSAEEEHNAHIDVDAEADLFIDRRKGLTDAPPNEGDILDLPRSRGPGGKFFRDMAVDEIKEDYQEVRKAKIREMVGFYDLGCFKRWFRHRVHNAIDARWVATWKMTKTNVGVKRRFAVRGFKDKFQDLDVYAGTICMSGQRCAKAVAAEHPDIILFSFDVSQFSANGLLQAFRAPRRAQPPSFSIQWGVDRSQLESVACSKWNCLFYRSI